ncbi:unnamed protein product [Camellia sinensis]
MISPSPFQCFILLHNLNQYAEAEQVALEVLRVQEKAFGEESLLPVVRLSTVGVYSDQTREGPYQVTGASEEGSCNLRERV